MQIHIDFATIRKQYKLLNEQHNITYKTISLCMQRDFIQVHRIVVSCRQPDLIRYIDVCRVASCLQIIETLIAQMGITGFVTLQERQTLITNCQKQLQTFCCDSEFNKITAGAL